MRLVKVLLSAGTGAPFTAQTGSEAASSLWEESPELESPDAPSESSPSPEASVLVRVRLDVPLSQVREEMRSVPSSGKSGMAARSSSSSSSRVSGRVVETV